MKSLFNWISNNIALSFFLLTQIVCLISGVIWITSSNQVDTISDSNEVVETVNQKTLIITEESQVALVQSEIENFDPSRKENFTIITTTRDSAITTFSENENAILVLAQPLNENELTGIKTQTTRLPLHQEIIDNSTDNPSTLPVFIRDNSNSNDEILMKNFLENNSSQDIVYQQFKKKSNTRKS